MTNPWPPILGTEVTIGTPPDTAQIRYRDYIETEAGQTRNNMFVIYLTDGDRSQTTRGGIEVTLKSTDLSPGITVTQDWHYGLNNGSKTALKIEISQNVKPGEYVFGIDVEINGRDYGTVPCTITVVE